MPTNPSSLWNDSQRAGDRLRSFFVVLLAIGLSAEVARLTAAGALAESNPRLAQKLAPEAPPVLVELIMAEVGRSAGLGQNPGQETLDQVRTLAAIAPLNAEPFLVEGAMALKSGNNARAERLLKHARLREPRSPAVRYLLADLWIRQGKLEDGLQEVGILTRLLPGSSNVMMPALSSYARTPAAPETFAALIAANPRLKSPLLTALAADPDNAELIAKLATMPGETSRLDTRAWQSRLLAGLVTRGEFDRAHGFWRRFARLGNGSLPLLYNGSFRALDAPPPFNWSFSASPAGVAEPGTSRLRVLFYGRQDVVLASQLLLLPPGPYRFEAPASGKVAAGGLSWILTCVRSSSRLMELKVGSTSSPEVAFQVPTSGCPAQRLNLHGHKLDSPADSDVRIGPASIERTRG